MSNLDNLIERFKKIAETTMDSYTRKHIYDAINLYDKEPKQLQKEEHKTYTQEEYDKGCRDAYERAIKFYGEPFVPDPSKQKVA